MIGDIVKGKVTGIQQYGVFVSLDKKIKGLIHVSEIKNGYIKDLQEIIHIGQKISVQIIDIDEYSKKYSLSLRAPLEDRDELENTHLHHKRYYTDKDKKIGFTSIGEKLKTWIQETLKDLGRFC
jgi:general stress protein 13